MKYNKINVDGNVYEYSIKEDFTIMYHGIVTYNEVKRIEEEIFKRNCEEIYSDETKTLKKEILLKVNDRLLDRILN